MLIKKYVVFSLVLFFSSGYVLANTDKAENVINEIALSMLKETPITNNVNFENIVLKLQESDEKINTKFALLSVEDKYKVLEIVRNTNLKKSNSNDKETLLLNRAVGDVLQDLRRQGIFAGDLSDNELRLLISESFSKYPTNDLGNNNADFSLSALSCQYEYFPLSISYAGSTNSYYTAYYHSPVTNSANGEFPCDVQLWYNTSKTKVYGLTQATRNMITVSGFGYNGKLAKRTTGGKDRIIIGSKRFIWGLTDYLTSIFVVIW